MVEWEIRIRTWTLLPPDGVIDLKLDMSPAVSAERGYYVYRGSRGTFIELRCNGLSGFRDKCMLAGLFW